MNLPIPSLNREPELPPHTAREDIAYGEARRLEINTTISRFLTLVTMALAPFLLMIDFNRWQAGRFDESALYWLLAGFHAALLLSALPGLALWAPRYSTQLKTAAAKAHLFLLTASLAGLGVLGIVERASLVMLAISLICTNLVFHITLRDRIQFNAALSVVGAITLAAFSEGDFLKLMIITTELVGLVMVCAVSGELRTRDYAALARAERGMARMAHYDALTGLANRRNLNEHIGHHLAAISRGRQFTVILIDVDHFKSVNDTHGHDVGDLVLKAVARVLQRGARESDIVGRWGGEEFLVLCPDTESEGGRLLAERLAATLRAEAIEKVGRKTASFGVAQAQPGEAIEPLLARADTALYTAKQNGRDQVCVVTLSCPGI
jgi:diguanylate cyclase (GGDEF)-like protein